MTHTRCFGLLSIVLASLFLAGTAPPTDPAEGTVSLEIEAGRFDRKDTPIHVSLPRAVNPQSLLIPADHRSFWIQEWRGGQGVGPAVPAQVEGAGVADPDGKAAASLTFILPAGIPAGESRTYRLTPSD